MFRYLNTWIFHLFLCWTAVSTWSAALVLAVPIQLYGLNYNSRKGPDWDWDKCKQREEILSELTLLSRMTNRIRTLSLRDCGQGEVVLEVVKELGMQIWLGLWVGPEDFVFQEELGELIGLIDRGLIDSDTVLGITVGSEAIYREDATVSQMIGNLNEVYEVVSSAGLSIPVTIVDIAPVYSKSAALRSAVNVTMTNTFPFWEGISIDGAVDDLQEDLDWILDRPQSRGKPFVLGETGWPSDGYIEGVGIAGKELQQRYLKEAFCRMDVESNWAYFWFTGIDNAWRQEQDPNNTIEGNWGFLYANLTLKSHFQDFSFQCRNGVTYSFGEIDWTIPEFTAAPADLDPQSCQSYNACSGLFGNCCPTDQGNYLLCCGPQPAAPALSLTGAPSLTLPSAAPTTPAPTDVQYALTAMPTSRPSLGPSTPPTLSPSTSPPTVSPTRATQAPTTSPTDQPTKHSISAHLTGTPSSTQPPTGPPTNESTTVSPVAPTPRPTVLVATRPTTPAPTQSQSSISANGALSSSNAFPTYSRSNPYSKAWLIWLAATTFVVFRCNL